MCLHFGYPLHAKNSPYLPLRFSIGLLHFSQACSVSTTSGSGTPFFADSEFATAFVAMVLLHGFAFALRRDLTAIQRTAAAWARHFRRFAHWYDKLALRISTTSIDFPELRHPPPHRLPARRTDVVGLPATRTRSLEDQGGLQRLLKRLIKIMHQPPPIPFSLRHLVKLLFHIRRELNIDQIRKMRHQRLTDSPTDIGGLKHFILHHHILPHFQHGNDAGIRTRPANSAFLQLFDRASLPKKAPTVW